MVRSGGFTVEVLSSQEGPLRRNYEELGAKVTLMDRHTIYSVESRRDYYAAVGALKSVIDFSRVDLVVCNTLMSFWGVNLARQAGKPSLFYIHESTSIYRFFSKALREHLHPLVEEAFHDATRSLFLCGATENYYKDYDQRGNFRIVPSWIQLDAIRSFKATNSREALRRKHGYGPDDVIITNIGTVCERKGQHTFIRAIKLLQEEFLNDGRTYRYILVGGRAGIYLDLLEADIRELKLRNLEIVHETRDVYDYFGLADLFVCSSFEESLPSRGAGGHGVRDSNREHGCPRHSGHGEEPRRGLADQAGRPPRPRPHDPHLPRQGAERQVLRADRLLESSALLRLRAGAPLPRRPGPRGHAGFWCQPLNHPSWSARHER
jgi:glycosyltransferase involved in cell wall biosynthesis